MVDIEFIVNLNYTVSYDLKEIDLSTKSRL